MRFELDNIFMDQILFYMENQEGDFILDTKERAIIDMTNNEYGDELDFDDNERFINLPKWLPNDGYRLMEKFAATLKNSVIRHELAEALNRNRGVFRAFRNVLEQYPETEKIWFSYKENEMKSIVLLWYNALREEWGLEPVGDEPEDTSSLVLEDFAVECKADGSSDELGFFITAESPNGEIAGSIKGNVKEKVLHIEKLSVNQEYRGLGLGKTLLSSMLEKADELKFSVTIDLPQNIEFFSRALYLENFKPVFQRFIRKVH